MIRYSVLIPASNAGSELASQLPELRRVLDLLALPYEVICIDQASARHACRPGAVDQQHPFLRVLTLDRRPGSRPRWPPELPPPGASWWWPSGGARNTRCSRSRI